MSASEAPPSSPPSSRLVIRKVKLCDRDWLDLGIQAALERKVGRGDLIRKAVTLYLDSTRNQRRGISASPLPDDSQE